VIANWLNVQGDFLICFTDHVYKRGSVNRLHLSGEKAAPRSNLFL